MKKLLSFIKPDGVQIVFFIGIIVVLILSVSFQLFNKEKISVNYADSESPQAKTSEEENNEIVRLGEDDKGLRYAERLKETSALGTSLAFYIVNESIKNQTNPISDVTVLMQHFSSSGLIPPQMQVLIPDTNVDYGLVKSNRGTYIVRYRAKPLLIEILSPATSERDESFLMRTPDTASAREFGKLSGAGNWASVYIAPPGNAKIPTPFSSTETFLNLGWKLDALRLTQLTTEQSKTIQEWLYRKN